MPSEESMIEDLRELEAELREKEEYRKANIIDLFIKYSTHCKIDKSKVKEKIKEYDKQIKKLENKKVWNEPADTIIRNRLCNYYNALQELLREE